MGVPFPAWLCFWRVRLYFLTAQSITRRARSFTPSRWRCSRGVKGFLMNFNTVLEQKPPSIRPAQHRQAFAHWMITQYCFLPFPCSVFFFSTSSLLFAAEIKKHMFPSRGRHIKHKLFLGKGLMLFQGQSETLSEQQRAVRALALNQVCTQYI